MAGLPAGVGRTAIGVAALRAAESERSDRLFADPYAARFVAAAEWVPGATSPALAVWVAIRTRFLDELVLDATSGKCRQVVLLGAGLDTRAFRLDWPAGVRVFEVDVPDVLDFKG
ncbi:MAG TPA: SAM-dependent methyltransferase, partial [Acidimicrobiales bacterium]